MGAVGGHKRFNAPHRLENGWLTSANVVADPTPGLPVTLVANSVVQTGTTSPAIVKFGPAVLPVDGYVFLASLRTGAVTAPTSYDRSLPLASQNAYVRPAVGRAL
jgi:hypothetical protein